MNRGISHATGDIVGIINSDDFYHSSNIISTIVKEFENNSDIDAVYGNLHYISHKNKNNIVRYYSSKHFTPFAFKFGFMPPHPTFFVYKHCYEKWGLYKPDYEISGDFELILRFMKHHEFKYKYLDIDMLTMRVGGISTSSLYNTFRLNKEVYRACKENYVYTNYLFLYLRYFVKILEYVPGLYKKHINKKE